MIDQIPKLKGGEYREFPGGPVLGFCILSWAVSTVPKGVNQDPESQTIKILIKVTEKESEPDRARKGTDE